MANPATRLRIEVACATAARQQVWRLRLPPGATIADALAAAEVAQAFPELDLRALPVGIFARPRAPSTKLRDGDRVEIYRPLPEHPNERRIKRLK